MATNKNQHYVPRIYLKSFTQNKENLAINLLNLDRRRTINGAPVKNQCSGDYFYGKDASLESMIQAVERNYSSIVSRVHDSHYILTEKDREILREFMLFQHMRTEAASRRSVEMFAGMEKSIKAPLPELTPSIKEAVQIAMRIFFNKRFILDDLKVCLVKNKTSMPFITSDDPSVIANRWHQGKQKLHSISPGLLSAGLLVFLPLSPKILCIAYDGDVYSISNENGWSEVKNRKDVAAFNEQQFLNAVANVYFRDWEHESWVLTSYDAIKDRRIACRHRVNYAIFDGFENGHKIYRVVDTHDVEPHQQALVHTQTLSPEPHSWPSQLKWRRKGFVYTNGTGEGYVRIAKISNTNKRYKKEPSGY